MLIKVDSRKVVVGLLRQHWLLRRRLDHSPVVLALQEHVVLLEFVGVGG